MTRDCLACIRCRKVTKCMHYLIQIAFLFQNETKHNLFISLAETATIQETGRQHIVESPTLVILLICMRGFKPFKACYTLPYELRNNGRDYT